MAATQCKQSLSAPKYVRETEAGVMRQLKLIDPQGASGASGDRQKFYDRVLQKESGSAVNKNQLLVKCEDMVKENDRLREQNLKLMFEITKIKQHMGKLQEESFSEYLSLMKERDARYSLYFENVDLQLKLKQLVGADRPPGGIRDDPVVLSLALDRCREELSVAQSELKSMRERYEQNVPRADHDRLRDERDQLQQARDQLRDAQEQLLLSHDLLAAKKNEVECELSEVRERCCELERAGTPRPVWELCADFVGGGRGRWSKLAGGLSSRDKLRALLTELGPAATTHVLEHFDGLGLDPSIPPYLRYSGAVRNLRLSRREVLVLIHDIWCGKLAATPTLSMQDYVTQYFHDRYVQPSMRAEWAYNLCSGAEHMLDDCQVKLFWGVLHGQLSEDIYRAYRRQWTELREQLYARGTENITMEEFERVARSTFPLKSDVDIHSLTDVVRKQLKLRLHQNDINLDKLLQENEEGFGQIELARELYRQRQHAQDKYLREVIAALRARGKGQLAVTPDQLSRAFVIVDPAIEHVRLQKHISWVFCGAPSASLRVVCARLAATDVCRAGPRRSRPMRHTRRL